MNGDVVPKLIDLENVFVSCGDVENGWKLDFCYLVESLLLNVLGAWTDITRLTLVLIKI